MMYDRGLVWLCLLYVYAVTASGAALKKCCPKGQTLSLNRLNDRQIVCIPNEEGSEPFHSYNLEIGEVAFQPSCLDWHSRRYSTFSNIVNLSGCVDMVQGHLQSIQCVPSDLQNIEVVRYQKCCAENYSYDLDQRRCVFVPNEFSAFHNFLGNNTAVIFKSSVPICQNDEVFVEYHSYHHNIWPIDGSIGVSHANRDELLVPTSFCIDSSWRSENAEQFSTKDTYSIIVRSCRPKSVCNHIPCMRRCCANDQMLERKPDRNRTECYDHPEQKNFVPLFYNMEFSLLTHEPEFVNQTDYGVLHNQQCQKYKLYDDEPMDKYFLHYKNGDLHVNDSNEPYNNDGYCIEYQKIGDDIKLTAFICFEDGPTRYWWYGVGLIISSVFLTATLFVYIALPKLLNLHGKTLVCYVASLLTGYLTLAVVQFNTVTALTYDYMAAFLIFFSIMSAFFWQSIMCFDIWWKFGSIRVTHGMRKSSENRRFFFYVLYAWGAPLIITGITLALDHYKVLPKEWQTGFGDETVWFPPHHWRAHLFFFLCPISIHVIANVILFVLTAIQCSRVKSEIHRMQHSNDENQKRFLADKAKLVFALNVKLFFVMGVSWIFEILTTFWHPSYIMFAVDLFNIFQGVYVFFIFAFKRTVFNAIKKRLGLRVTSGGSSTPRTTTTGQSGLNMTNINRENSNKLNTDTSMQPLAPKTSNAFK